MGSARCGVFGHPRRRLRGLQRGTRRGRMGRRAAQRTRPESLRLQRKDAHLRERSHHPFSRILSTGPGAHRKRPGGRLCPQRNRRDGGHPVLRARRRGLLRHRARAREQPERRQPRGRLHHHAAACAQHAPIKRGKRYLVSAQSSRSRARHRDGAGVFQRRHPAYVPEHDQLRLGVLWHRGRSAALLLQERNRPFTCRGGDTCGHPSVADVQQPRGLSRKLHEASQRRARPHAHARNDHAGGTR